MPKNVQSIFKRAHPTGMTWFLAIGGAWPWALIAIPVFLLQWRAGFRASDVFALVLPGLCWLALYQWTGDRRFFFPYTMQYAAQMAALTAGTPLRRAIAGGGTVVLVFVLIRIAQSAGARVLTVEILVAAAVLALSPAVYHRSPAARTLGALLAGALAYAGLAL